MTRRIGFFLVIALPMLALPLQRSTADGDPADEHDFSGQAPLADFLERIDSTVYRHGLWTIQEVVHKKPFGDGWTIEDNQTCDVNVFYGSRPLWCCGEHRCAGVSFPDGLPGRSATAWFDADGVATSHQAIDCTGSDAITVVVTTWEAKGCAGFYLLRLVEDGAVGSRVEVLFEGAGYDELVDLDDDGIAEIVARDLSHDYADYLAANSYWPQVVMRWNPDAGRFLCAQYEFEDAVWKDSERPAFSTAEAITSRVAACRETLAKSGNFEAFDSLSMTVIELLYTGRAAEAIGLVEDSRLKHYSVYLAPDEQPRSKLDWWTALLNGCTTSRYWPGLCACYPELPALGANSVK